jgi:hypothetical protein
MKNIKKFNNFYILENNSYKLPASTGNPEKDQDIFWFSEDKSIVIDAFFSMFDRADKLKGKEINPQDFYCKYKPGMSEITYSYEFWTENEEIVKKSQNYFEGQEWRMIAEVPFDIIEKLNSGEISEEDAKKRIESESNWELIDGMSKSLVGDGGWQLAYIKGNDELTKEIEQEQKARGWRPQWLKDFTGWINQKFG